ncbi:MAG: type II toxin-antitoxin system RelE/ParE family toxin [Gammaproteobacteria bacterium]|nr:type II toxin-antitoxin system RelE/ParE family toxin [Gammaproteobacteria bacterium]
MKAKPVVARERANRDIDEAIAWYLGEHAAHAAFGFIDAVEGAFSHVSRFPSAGSPRYALELNLPGLRCWPVPGYPWLVFYLERDDHIDIWRVLHSQRDIPAWMDVPDPA